MGAPNCYTCQHRRPVPGDCHISCVAPGATVRGDSHGIREGWFFWPLNFDPVWLRACDSHTPVPKDGEGGS